MRHHPTGHAPTGQAPTGHAPTGHAPTRPRLGTGFAALIVGSLAVLSGCSSGAAGLGKGACPYVRPRLVRVDTDRARLPTGLPDLTSVAQDIADYVHTNLPHGGRAQNDQVLVRFSAALSAFVKGGAADRRSLDPAEGALSRECAVHGY